MSAETRVGYILDLTGGPFKQRGRRGYGWRHVFSIISQKPRTTYRPPLIYRYAQIERHLKDAKINDEISVKCQEFYAAAERMNQQCKVCGEPAAGFHFGAFTCEGCKSFFGRSYNNLSSISECKNNGECVINKKNRTSCKACRLRKCLLVGMSKSGSRYGRRSNWFKIHCLLQEQKQKSDEGRLGAQIASLNRNKEELMLLGLEEYKTGYWPSTSSPGSDSSEEKCKNPPYFGFPPILPQVFLPQPFHPAFLPSPYLYQDHGPWDESPIDLSTKSAEDSATTDSDEDINVDELPEEPAIIRAPLDLTTKVV